MGSQQDAIHKNTAFIDLNLLVWIPSEILDSLGAEAVSSPFFAVLLEFHIKGDWLDA